MDKNKILKNLYSNMLYLTSVNKNVFINKNSNNISLDETYIEQDIKNLKTKLKHFIRHESKNSKI